MSTKPTIEFLSGLPEELTDVRLRRGKTSGIRNVLMIFENLRALELVNSYTRQSKGALHLIDQEGEIQVTPSSLKIRFGGDDGDDLHGVECQFEIHEDDHWERFMRFMHRYAEANGMGYQDS
ncbi:photosystem II reaction center protein Psb28 [Spirulina subsalsa]|uniref:photosystem II reaction center protein Psb28 n=1 Tax=Spirulina subsalsa TaxID=54311 RepID=UPI000526AFBF|nr:photosystem II reaction center protein Psb28 [Spirulina subsalsa]